MADTPTPNPNLDSDLDDDLNLDLNGEFETEFETDLDETAPEAENLEPLPARETPLVNLVDESVLGTEDSPFGTGTRRIPHGEMEVIAAANEEEEAPPAPRPTAPTPPTSEPIASKAVRQQQGSRLPLLPLAFGLIGVGALLLATKFVEGLVVTTGTGMVLLLGSLVLTYIFRFFESGRRERGLFFIAMVLMVWGFLVALDVVSNRFSLVDYWALFIAGVGVAFVFTFMFERTHQTGLLFPGILLIFVSGIAVATTQEIISVSIQNAIGDYWYLLLTFLGLTLIPTALQDN